MPSPPPPSLMPSEPLPSLSKLLKTLPTWLLNNPSFTIRNVFVTCVTFSCLTISREIFAKLYSLYLKEMLHRLPDHHPIIVLTNMFAFPLHLHQRLLSQSFLPQLHKLPLKIRLPLAFLIWSLALKLHLSLSQTHHRPLPTYMSQEENRKDDFT
jgi:hypothetical protein